MSQFLPSDCTLDPPHRPDHLAGAVLSALSRPLMGRAADWGLLRTAVLGGISFGIWPLLSWPRRFDDRADHEEQQFWHLAEWMRVRSGDASAARLRELTRGLQARGTVLAFTYGYGRVPASGHFTVDWIWRLFLVWNVALSLGYLVHWVRV